MFHKILWQYTCSFPHTDFFFSFSCSIVFNMLGATVLILAHWVHWLSHKSVDIQPVHEKYSMRKYGESSPSRWFDLIILILFPVCGWQQHNSLFYFSNRRSCRCINSCCTAHREAMGRHNTCGALEHIIQPKPLCISGYRKLPTTCCFEHPGVQPSQYDFHILPIFLLPAHWTVHFLPVWSKSLIGRIWADKQCYSFHFQQL